MSLTTATSAPSVGRADHVCRVYDDPASFRAAALDYLRAGLAAGEQLIYLGSGHLDTLRRDLDGLAEADALVDDGTLTVHSLDDIYGLDAVVHPPAPVAAYANATEAALAQGYRGLRVVAEATALVRTPAQREAFARYEHLIDRYIVHHPFSAMCGYDRGELGRDAAAEIACLHPRANEGATHFRWWAERAADVALGGEVDIASHELFDRTLERTLPLVGGGSLVVDAQALGFIDHRGVLMLDEHAQKSGTEVILAAGAPVLRKLVDLLDLRAVRAGWSG